ncbi:hypothetical protein BI312_07515 [Xanthomonas citri pv. citri]|uniref:Uncharacterized protein n=1 Tax=Xanthomonas citri pv. citri TaxID=611301 RepID=A0A0U5FHP4_XANCI|nr:hypothetical protein BI314_07350 [Xanthomonas citri pv. citri]QYF46201.1 hypothetical protein HZS93_03544 [Xanthomonas citri]APR14735.1 hypothetical protein BI315_07545 [Xanthomonas citri pv. citri]APR21286.1 hypothetical protein BI316_18930 [Xanthomonas citri pv. citri]APR26489.1 hypothetical protein BJD09_22340 [Xanthomonas citri pv. citri]
MSKITNFTKVRVTTEEQCQGGRWVAHACLHVAWAEQVIEKLPNAGSSPDRFVSRAQALRAGRRAALHWEEFGADVVRFGFQSR